MRKFIFLLSAFIYSNCVVGQSQRLVFIEEFTQASCPPCAQVNPDFNSLMQYDTDTAVAVRYHTNWPGTDPMNNQDPNDVQTRVTYYSVGGVPDGYMDGGNEFWPGSISPTDVHAEYAIPSPFTINTSHWFNAMHDSVFVNCQILCTQAVSMTTPVLRIAMIEKHISFTIPPGSNGETDFYNVVRKLYPNAAGTKLVPSWTVGQSMTLSFGAPVPYYTYKLSEVAFVAWIQDDNDHTVKQAGFDSIVSPPSDLAPTADFSEDVNTSCNGLVSFQDQSTLFPTSWLWDFGDGNTSSLQNPVHQYFSAGTYNVKLTAANANGSNQLTKNSLVTVSFSGSAPSGTNAKRCGPGVVNLSASASGNGLLNWYNAKGTMVNSGNNYSPSITGMERFYVSESIPNAVTSIGPADSTLGGGSFYTVYAAHGLYFNVSQPCNLVSVVTYANSAGMRTIEVLDYLGSIVDSVSVFLPLGIDTAKLNFSLNPGTGYFICFAGNNPIDCYRNNANAVYPYSNNAISITGADVGGGYYYFFYDWQVQPNACSSPSTVVTATDTCSLLGINENSLSNTLSVFPNPGNGILNALFSTSTTDNYLLSISNILGQVVYEGELKNFSGTYTGQIDITSFGKGLYLFVVSNSANDRMVKRIIVY
jgi:PKD repeat protein